MNFRQLEIFLAVAEQQSFVKASRQLFIAQSAVSIAIQKLENTLDLKLISRSKKHVELTDEGQALLQHARKILSQAAEAKLELAEMGDLKHGEVKLGVPAMLASYYFPDYIVEFKKRHPGIKITIFDEGTKLIQQHLQEGVIDMGIVNLESVPDNLETYPVIDEEMLICIPRKHSLAKRQSIVFSDLKDEQLILYREGYFLREIVNQLCNDHKLEPNIGFEVNLVQLMKSLVLSGLGISFCLKSVTAHERHLIGIPLNPEIRLKFGIAWRKNNYLSKANRAFVDFILTK